MSLADIYGDDNQMIEYIVDEESFDDFNDNHNLVAEQHLFRYYESKLLKLPDLHNDMEWINTKRPLTLEDLMGRVVILDFFTYCCINCEHILPYLRKVEELFCSNSIIMIGVHSPKFPNEKNTENLEDAILKNDISHPVLNDKEKFIWNSLGVYCWPTVLILGPNAQVLFCLVGESQVKKLSLILDQTLDYLVSRNIILRTDPFPIAKLMDLTEFLRYPTYVDSHDKNIIVSDTGHNRLILLNLRGEVLEIIGKGDCGFSDGSFSESLFNNPHGIAWWMPDIVFVADTGNHCIRKIDLTYKRVITVFVGNADPKDSTSKKFSSPWDVCIGSTGNILEPSLDVLYIAVAGVHQIWALYLRDCYVLRNIKSGTCIPFAGSGHEECRNNNYKMKAGFAQPSGITYSESERILYIADSESSSVRSLALESEAVSLLAGGGFNPEDLFQFGDKDGQSINAKLQHPLAVCLYTDKKILVSDTYNHKIKLINSETKECTTVVGGRGDNVENECSFQEALFNEPCGICCINDKKCLLVVDTNNHCLKVINFESNSVKKMNIFYPNNEVDMPIDESSTRSTSVKLNPLTSNKNLREIIKMDLDYECEIHCIFTIETEGLSLMDHSPYSISFKGCDWKIICQSGNIFNTNRHPSFILKRSNVFTRETEIDFDFTLNLCNNQTCSCLNGKFTFSVTISESPYKTFLLKFIL